MSNPNLIESKKLCGQSQELAKILQHCSSAHLHVDDDKDASAISYQLERIATLLNLVICESNGLKRILNHEKEPKFNKYRNYRLVEKSENES